MEHKRRALAVILATLLMTLGVHGAAQATLIPTLGSVTPSGGNTFIWTYDHLDLRHRPGVRSECQRRRRPVGQPGPAVRVGR